MKIRRAYPEDSVEISKLALEAIDNVKTKEYSLEQIREWKNLNIVSNVETWFIDREVFVAIEDNKIVGTISLNKNKFSRFFVKPDHQGNGIGKKILEFVEKRAKNNGYETIWMTSVLNSIGFYKKMGYESKEEVVFNYNNVKFPELKMEKRL